MRLIPVNETSTDNAYNDFYNQTGRGQIPIFKGSKHQVGYGLGGISSSLFKAAMPMVKAGAKSLGKTALNAGLNMAKDMLDGNNVKQSLRKNVRMLVGKY